jgi:hypothetical protein
MVELVPECRTEPVADLRRHALDILVQRVADSAHGFVADGDREERDG